MTLPGVDFTIAESMLAASCLGPEWGGGPGAPAKPGSKSQAAAEHC
jgi:hypothetical protein